MRISVVIVTFNRLKCLQKALPLYEAQNMLPQNIIVVNNNSSDGTKEYLDQWKKEPGAAERIVLHLDENTGGAGGFHAGMARALETDCDWIWVADDDAYPEADALKAFGDFEQQNPAVARSAAGFCGTIMDYDKKGILLGHHCRKRSILGIPVMTEVPEEEYNALYFELDFISYVGTAFRKEALCKAGLPRKDFFIYSDDWEHSIRVRKVGKLLCIPASCVLHVGESTQVAGSRKAVWHDYYSTRNILIALRSHFGNLAFLVRAVCRMLTALSTFNPRKIKLFTIAIGDALHERTGVHEVYKPGWTEDKA